MVEPFYKEVISQIQSISEEANKIKINSKKD